MYIKPAGVEQYATNNPQKPYILCEYSHAMGNSCGGLHLYTDMFDKYDVFQGAFIWDWVDQAIRTTTPEGLNIWRTAAISVNPHMTGTLAATACCLRTGL